MEPAPLPVTTPALEQNDVQCQQCGAGLSLRRFDKAVLCPYCQSTNVVRRPPREGVPLPAFVLGFARPEAEVRQLVARWGRRAPWYAPSGFRHLEVERLEPVYVPAYLVTGEADCTWSARAGYEYVKTENKKRRRAIEWHDVGGRATVRLHPLLISASHRVNNDDLGHLEPFDYGRLAVYSDAAIAGWPAEHAARTPQQINDALKQELQQQLVSRMSALVPGEKRTAASVRWNLLDSQRDLVLVPVWSMLVRYSPTKSRVRVLVNGQTGAVHGQVPRSMVKVTLAVLAALLVVGALVFFLGSRTP